MKEIVSGCFFLNTVCITAWTENCSLEENDTFTWNVSDVYSLRRERNWMSKAQSVTRSSR